MAADTDARLANRILLGLALGAVAGVVVLAIGSAAPAVLDGAKWFATTICDPLGQVFLRMLFFVVIPLVFASLASGVVQLGGLADLGPLAGRTLTLFFMNMSRRARSLALKAGSCLRLGTRLSNSVWLLFWLLAY